MLAEMPTALRGLLLRACAGLWRAPKIWRRTIAAGPARRSKFAQAEVDRGIALRHRLSRGQAHHGETIPLDAVARAKSATATGPGGGGRHCRHPALQFPAQPGGAQGGPGAGGGGSAVVLKPASTTPLTAVKLCEILAEAGLPAGAVNLVIGSGSTVGSGW